MDLKQKRSPISAPHPLAVVTIISGAFFLFGVGLSTYTLNAVADSTRSNSQLNIARLLKQQPKITEIETDLGIFTTPINMFYSYPAGWTEDKNLEGSMWAKRFEEEEDYLEIAIAQATEETSVEAALSYIESDEVTEETLHLVESDLTGQEKLDFNIYAYTIEESTKLISVVELPGAESAKSFRFIMSTNLEQPVLRGLIEDLNI